MTTGARSRRLYRDTGTHSEAPPGTSSVCRSRPEIRFRSTSTLIARLM
jgi:hypothetical protein